MRRSLDIAKMLLPTVVSFEKLRLPLNITGILLTAWIVAGIFCQALAAMLPPPKAERKVAARAGQRDEMSDLSRSVARYAYDVIIERNIFDSTNKVSQLNKPKADPTAGVRRNYSGKPMPTSLPLRLLGTIVSSNPRLSVATLSVSGKPESEQFGVGDRVLGASVSSVERNRVYIINNGMKEYIESDDAKASRAFAPAPSYDAGEPVAAAGGGVREVAPGKYAIDKGRVEAVMANLNEVMTQARVVPHFENGKPGGWKIFAIKPNSIYSELNLQNGDIIQRINGVEVDSPAKALEMYQQLSSESHISMDIIRAGTKQSFDYDIK